MPVTDVRFAAICLSIFLALREKWTETKERIEPLLCRDYYCNWCFLELNSASDRAKEHIMRRNVGPPLLLSESESFFEVYMRRGSSFSPSKMSNRSDTMLPRELHCQEPNREHIDVLDTMQKLMVPRCCHIACIV